MAKNDVENEVARNDRGEAYVTELQEWAKTVWKEGCLQGDLARDENLTNDEVAMLECAREGYLAVVAAHGTEDSAADVIRIVKTRMASGRDQFLVTLPRNAFLVDVIASWRALSDVLANQQHPDMRSLFGDLARRFDATLALDVNGNLTGPTAEAMEAARKGPKQ